jgi:hypothetical protein
MVQGTKVNEITAGGLTISIWSAKDPPAHHHDSFRIDIGVQGDDDWVCIGAGGGNASIDPGNFLTAYHPSLDTNGNEATLL